MSRSPSATLYPTDIDFPNVQPQDKKLWFFPFLPTTVKLREFLRAEGRMDAIEGGPQYVRAQTLTEAVEKRPEGDSANLAVIPDSTRRFVNVALGKPAVQSTLSIWSREQEAAGLVNGNFEQNFGVHTDIEDTPWVSIDLLRSVPVEALIVHNRRDGFQDRARSLKIAISAEGSEWTIVHSGLCHFGSLGNGIPLVIPLSNRLWTRYVRLSLEERNYLCISQLEVLADQSQIRLLDIREALSLDCPLFGEHPGRGSHECYTLTSRDRSWTKPLIGLELNENGAFGNSTIQYAQAVILAQRLGLRYIKISENDRSKLIRLEKPLSLDGVTFIPATTPLPLEGVFLRGSFFDSDVSPENSSRLR